MSSRRMSLLPRATLHSDSEQLARGQLRPSVGRLSSQGRIDNLHLYKKNHNHSF
jgi:hypothetical protein